jgi:hypothetical protein
VIAKTKTELRKLNNKTKIIEQDGKADNGNDVLFRKEVGDKKLSGREDDKKPDYRTL